MYVHIHMYACSSRFCQKMAFWHRKWKRTVFCQDVHLNVLKLSSKNESHSMLSFPKNCGVCIDFYDDGVTYTCI